MLNIAIYIKDASVRSVNSIYNFIYYNSMKNRHVDLFVIGSTTESIKKTYEHFSVDESKLSIYQLNFYKKEDSKIQKFIKYILSYMKNSIGLTLKIYDSIFFIGDSSLYHKQILNYHKSNEVFFWMLELPLDYTGYYSKIARNSISKIEYSLVNKSNSVILPNYERVEFLKNNNKHFRNKKMFIVSNFPKICDLSLFQENVRFISPKKKYICFTGYISLNTIPLNEISLVMDYIYQEYGVSLYLAGRIDNQCKSIIDNQVNEESIQYLGFLNNTEVIDLQKKSIAGIAMYLEKSMNHVLCAPQKIYEYLNLRVPVIGSNNKPIANLILQNKLGKIINDITVEEIRKSIEDIVYNNEKYRLNIAEWSRTHLDEKSILDEIDVFYKK